jgi:hypothetical protein
MPCGRRCHRFWGTLSVPSPVRSGPRTLQWRILTPVANPSVALLPLCATCAPRAGRYFSIGPSPNQRHHLAWTAQPRWIGLSVPARRAMPRPAYASHGFFHSESKGKNALKMPRVVSRLQNVSLRSHTASPGRRKLRSCDKPKRSRNVRTSGMRNDSGWFGAVRAVHRGGMGGWSGKRRRANNAMRVYPSMGAWGGMKSQFRFSNLFVSLEPPVFRDVLL